MDKKRNFDIDIQENHRVLAKGVYMTNDTRKSGINNNDLIIGPSGAGKTRGYVIPNILACDHSMIVSDTKGDLLKKLRPHLEEKGFKIIELDFKDLKNSPYGYNPFDYIRTDENGKYNEQDIEQISEILAPTDGNKKDPYWDKAAKQFLSFMIAYVMETLPEDERNMVSVLEVYNLMRRTGPYGNPIMDPLMEKVKEAMPDSLAVKKYDLITGMGAADKHYASVMGILGEKLDTYAFDGMRSFINNEKRINFADIGREKTIVFLQVSDTDYSMERIINLFYTQALQKLCEAADSNEDHRLDIPVRIILDDFAASVEVPDFDKTTSIIRSRDIYVSVTLQSLSQLKSHYGHDDATTIVNNCETILYLGGTDLDTANYISQRTNKTVDNIMNMPAGSAFLCQRRPKNGVDTKQNYQKRKVEFFSLEEAGIDI